MASLARPRPGDPDNDDSEAAPFQGRDRECGFDDDDTACRWLFRADEGVDATWGHESDDADRLELEETRELLALLTPQQQARRAQCRKIVVGVVAGALVLALFGAVKLASFRRARTGSSAHHAEAQTDVLSIAAIGMGEARGTTPAGTAEPTAQVDSVLETPPVLSRAPDPPDDLQSTSGAEPSASSDPPASVPGTPAPELPAPLQPAASEASATAGASSALVAEPYVADGVDPKKEAFRLLNVGKFRDVIPLAQAAIARDPEDASPYLYLGTALQSSGRWKDGIEAYCRCVHAAKRGPVHECRAVGGH